MKKPDTTTLQNVIARLEALPDRPRLSTYDLIAQLSTTISKTTGRGYDIDDIVTILRESGVKLARSTVRSYMSRARAGAVVPCTAASLDTARGEPLSATATSPSVPHRGLHS